MNYLYLSELTYACMCAQLRYRQLRRLCVAGGDGRGAAASAAATEYCEP